MDYCVNIYGNCNKTTEKQLQILQKKAIRIIDNKKYNEHTDPIFKNLKILKLEDVKKYNLLKLAYEIYYHEAPRSVYDMFPLYENDRTRSQMMFKIPFYRTDKLQSMPAYMIPKIWNELDVEITKIEKKELFLKRIKEDMLASY